MLSGRRLRVLAIVGPLLGGLGAAAAPRQALAQEAPVRNVREARRHFESARRDYGQGDYRDALAELQAAHALDPTAKDLVFNLGVVEEKLSDIDEALVWFHAYTTMTLTPQERGRAEAYVHRLEGAKKELDRGAPPPASARKPSPVARPSPAEAPPPPNAPLPPEAPSARARGRIDAATIAAGGVAAAGLAFGTVMAIVAEREYPPNGFVTGVVAGADGSYADLADRTHAAHRDAVIADVGFGAALAAGIVAAVLYFARERSAPGARASGGEAVTVSGGPVAGGAAIVVGGAL